ncbi:hypothetical protein IGI04_023238 [Brassica rapa subsp. trilocularis]|uniref:Uncharacterized protein n=1 Tax=Brassica rapa subsp. trilocularis TaxID=1813537 RepID=A0ABQ7M4K2_BRACM|nr:hypothetical protein IGI04_023238 [Brassica rapa subsp. trilocularis]
MGLEGQWKKHLTAGDKKFQSTSRSSAVGNGEHASTFNLSKLWHRLKGADSNDKGSSGNGQALRHNWKKIVTLQICFPEFSIIHVSRARNQFLNFLAKTFSFFHRKLLLIGCFIPRQHKSEAGWDLRRTGSKHDGIEPRRENPKLGNNPNFAHQNESRKIFGFNHGRNMPEGLKLRKSAEKLEVSQCMSSGCGVNHLISCRSPQARGVGTHGSSTCGLTCESMRCRCICNRSMLIEMWVRHTGCHQPEGDWLLSSINRHAHLHISTHPNHFRSSFREFPRSVTTPVLSRCLEEFLFELRVVQGRPFRSIALAFQRHQFEVNQHPIAEVMPVLLESCQYASREEAVEKRNNASRAYLMTNLGPEVTTYYQYIPGRP